MRASIIGYGLGIVILSAILTYALFGYYEYKVDERTEEILEIDAKLRHEDAMLSYEEARFKAEKDIDSLRPMKLVKFGYIAFSVLLLFGIVVLVVGLFMKPDDKIIAGTIEQPGLEPTNIRLMIFHKSKKFPCPKCEKLIHYGAIHCPYCEARLDWIGLEEKTSHLNKDIGLTRCELFHRIGQDIAVKKRIK